MQVRPPNNRPSADGLPLAGLSALTDWPTPTAPGLTIESSGGVTTLPILHAGIAVLLRGTAAEISLVDDLRVAIDELLKGVTEHRGIVRSRFAVTDTTITITVERRGLPDDFSEQRLRELVDEFIVDHAPGLTTVTLRRSW